jgi:hypothetical protein
MPIDGSPRRLGTRNPPSCPLQLPFNQPIDLELISEADPEQMRFSLS